MYVCACLSLCVSVCACVYIRKSGCIITYVMIYHIYLVVERGSIYYLSPIDAHLWPRVQFQVDVIHLVRSTGAIVSNPHLHTVKSCPGKSRLIKNGHHMHSVMLAIVHSCKLKKFHLWCKLGWFSQRQLHILIVIPI